MGVEPIHTATRRIPCPLAALLAALVGSSGVARADNGTPTPPPPTPGISQYVETVPTSSGGAVHKPRKKTTKTGSRLAPAQVDAITESPSYGAPQSKLSLKPSKKTSAVSPSKRRAGTSARTHVASRQDVNAVSAAVSAVDGKDDSHFIWLAAVLLAITAGAIAAATRFHRRRA